MACDIPAVQLDYLMVLSSTYHDNQRGSDVLLHFDELLKLGYPLVGGLVAMIGSTELPPSWWPQIPTEIHSS